jgi:hypothetical protein
VERELLLEMENILNYYDTSTVRIDGLGWGVDTDAKLFTTFVTLKNK